MKDTQDRETLKKLIDLLAEKQVITRAEAETLVPKPQQFVDKLAHMRQDYYGG